MALIELSNVSKTYNSAGVPAVALKGADLTIEAGEMLAIMGPSGSGKSTMLTILGAMNPPTTGTILVDGIDVYGLSSERRADFRHEYLGFIFQQQHLVPYLTALENVMLPLAISRRSQAEQTQMASRPGASGAGRQDSIAFPASSRAESRSASRLPEPS